MSNPKDPWGPRPEDAPTEHLGPQGQAGFDKAGHTDDPTVAYGSGSAETSKLPSNQQQYPSTEQFAPWTPPPVDATRQMPANESQWGGYENGPGGYDAGYGAQWSGAPSQTAAMPPGGPPPGDPGQYGYAQQPPDQPPRKRNTGLWIALGLAVVALIAVAGVAAGVMLGNKDSDSSAAATTTRAASPGVQIPSIPTPTQSRSPGSLPSGLPSLPGLDNLGATMGTISANSGGTLTLSTLSGETVTVRTSAKTQVISLSAAKASDLPVGDVVMVQGDKGADGAIDAKVIISTGLPGGPR